VLPEGSLKRENADSQADVVHGSILVVAVASPDRGSDARGGRPDTPTMIVRRDGSIDVRVLAGRLAQYGGVVLVAAVVGALIALVGS
jgi:hypothetical protein